MADEIRQLHRAWEGKKAALADLRRLPVANSRREKPQRAKLTGSLEVAIDMLKMRVNFLRRLKDLSELELRRIKIRRDELLCDIKKCWRALEKRGIVVSRDISHTRVPKPPLPYKFECGE